VASTGQRHSLAVLAASALWGTTGVVAKHATAGSSQLLVGLSTFGFGALLLFAVDTKPTLKMLRNRSLWPLLCAGAVGVIGYAGMYYVAMDLVGVAVGNVLALGSGPVFAALLELAIEHRPIRRGWAASAAVTISGVALLALSAHAAPGTNPLLGVLLALGAGFGYALYSWAAARLITAGKPSRPVMSAIFTLAAVPLVPTFLLAHPGPLVSGQGLLVLSYLAIIPMAVAYLLFGYGFRGLTASTAMTLALTEPLVATVLAILLLHERLSPSAWLGLALILTGIAFVAVTEKPQATQ